MSRSRKTVREPAPSTALYTPQVIEVAAGVFKDTCLQLLDRVRDEHVEILVTKRGEPVARLVGPGRRVPSSRGMLRGTVLWQGDIVSPDHEEWGDLA